MLIAADGHGPVHEGGGGPGEATAVRGAAPADRLRPRPAWWSATVTAGVDLTPPPGHILSWSPLVGLTYAGEARAVPGGCGLVRLTAPEIISMEEKDIRRDFIAKLSVEDVTVAGLAVVAPHAPGTPVDEHLMADLLDRRDLAVAGLRIAGLSGFADPELLGWYAYEGNLRHRRETVLRQTILMGLGSGDSAELDADALSRSESIWALLADYTGGGRVSTIDGMLDLFRRAHHSSLHPTTRATLLFALLESLLGRFRDPGEPVQLEDLVGALPGLDPAAAQWFGQSGRAIRNATAHGAWSPEADAPELAQLQVVCGAALQELLVVWTTGRGGAQNPAKLLARHLTGRLADRQEAPWNRRSSSPCWGRRYPLRWPCGTSSRPGRTSAPSRRSSRPTPSSSRSAGRCCRRRSPPRMPGAATSTRPASGSTPPWNR